MGQEGDVKTKVYTSEERGSECRMVMKVLGSGRRNKGKAISQKTANDGTFPAS